jgi:hypothetical protein
MKNTIHSIFTFFELIGRIIICLAPVLIFVAALMWVQPWEWLT